MDLAAEIAVFQPDVLILDLGWDSAGDQEIEAFADHEELDSPVVAMVSDESYAADAWVESSSDRFSP